LLNVSYYAKEFPVLRRAIAHLSRSLTFSYTARRGIAKGLKRKGGLGFLPGTASPTAEESFLWSLDLSGKTVFDVGGFEGVMTLFFASRAARVITYEPISSSRKRILANLAVNGFTNVVVRDCALSSEPGELKITINDLMAGGASGDPEISSEFANSGVPLRVEVVPVTTLDREVQSGQPLPDLVKVDVEGMEYHVLQGMRELVAARHPCLYFELHGTTPEDKHHNAQSVIGTLLDSGYAVFDVEHRNYISTRTPVTGRESHVFAHPPGSAPF
jgi:FkbM family methyltransferase